MWCDTIVHPLTPGAASGADLASGRRASKLARRTTLIHHINPGDDKPSFGNKLERDQFGKDNGPDNRCGNRGCGYEQGNTARRSIFNRPRPKQQNSRSPTVPQKMRAIHSKPVSDGIILSEPQAAAIPKRTTTPPISAIGAIVFAW